MAFSSGQSVRLGKSDSLGVMVQDHCMANTFIFTLELAQSL